MRSLANRERCTEALGKRQWNPGAARSNADGKEEFQYILEVGPEEHAIGLAMGWGEEMMTIKDNSYVFGLIG